MDGLGHNALDPQMTVCPWHTVDCPRISVQEPHPTRRHFRVLRYAPLQFTLKHAHPNLPQLHYANQKSVQSAHLLTATF